MELNGFGPQTRFPPNLDPTAQEFWPAYPPPPPPLIPVYYTYAAPPPLYSPADHPPPPSLPPPSMPPTRAVLLTSVPTDASESAVRRDLEVFGDVRAVQMGRVREGIVTVHFYDLRAAHAALHHIREQHMQHQHRLRLFYYYSSPAPLLAPPSPPLGACGLVSGRVVWAQFVIPALNAFPDGHNQGTLVVFNLDPYVSASALAQIFAAFGPVRELRETPMKKHQKFVEFHDVRDAAAALAEMNGKEIRGKQVAIEFSRPGGGHGRRLISNHYDNPQSRSMKCPPPPPPPPSTPPRTPAASCVRSIPRRTSPTNVPPRAYSQPSKKCFRGTGSACCKDEGSVGNLSLNDNGVEEAIRENDGRLSVKKCGSSIVDGGEGSVPVVITKTKTTSPRPWKGKNKSLDPRFLIKEDSIVDQGCKDSRTTVMIKNIPNKYSQKLLLNMLDNHCIHHNEQIANQGDEESLPPLSSYDFLYLPIDFNNKCNVGYGFVNMTSPDAALRLHKAFHQQHWEVFNSRKICEVTYARVQGLEALKEHFKNSKFACETEEYLPVVFSPARDGRAHLTDPLPIVPCSHAVSGSATTVSVPSSSPSLSSDGACEEMSGDGVNDESDVVSGVGSSNGGDDYHDDCDVGNQIDG